MITSWGHPHLETRPAVDASDAANMAMLEGIANGARTGRYSTRGQTATEMVRIDRLLQHPTTWSDLTLKEGKLIAFSFGYPREDTDIHHLDTLMVDPDHWGSGRGWDHLNKSITHAALSGAAVIDLWTDQDNERARALYERSQFIIVRNALRRHASGALQVKYQREL